MPVALELDTAAVAGGCAALPKAKSQTRWSDSTPRSRNASTVIGPGAARDGGIVEIHEQCGGAPTAIGPFVEPCVERAVDHRRSGVSSREASV